MTTDFHPPATIDLDPTPPTSAIPQGESTSRSASSFTSLISSFDTPSGARGARQPRGLLVRWINIRATNRIRRRGGTIKHMDGLVLTTIGAKSGATRRTPVAWFPDGPHSWLIVASAGGAARNPAWYHNIAAHPRNVRIHVAGRTIPVAAEQLHDQGRDHAWRRIVSAAPRFAKDARRTDRKLPVIRLTVR